MARGPLRLITPKEKIKQQVRRLNQLPKVIEGIINAKLKRDCIGVIETYQQGLKTNSLGLRALPSTYIKRKARLGLPMPSNPLYGYGDRKKNSYFNMFYIQPIKNGYKVRPRWAKHHSSDLKLRDLFNVHEYGTVITTKFATFRIPPRPAGARAYVKYIKSINAKTDERFIKLVLNKYLRSGNVEHGRGIDNILNIAKRFPKYANPN